MTDALIEHIRRKVTLTEEEVTLILSQFVPRVVKKNEHIFRAGQIASYNAYVVKGCFRYYKKNEALDEFTTRFAFEDWWIGDVQSLFGNEPAVLSLQALETADVLTIDKKGYDFLFEHCPSFRELFRINRDKGFNKLNELMLERMSKTAEERYRDLLTRYPHILQRIPLKYIASYLGIMVQSLSRIRKNITRPVN